MKKRLLSFVLTTAMAASLLAGCGSSAQQGAAAGNTAGTEAASSGDTAAADDGAQAADQDTAADGSSGEMTGSSGEVGDNDGKTVRIGVICSLTGGSAIYGEGAQNAVDPQGLQHCG